MKKWLQIIIVFSIVTVMTACENKAQEKSIQEIMNNSIKASQNLKSFHLSMDIEQISTPNGEESVETNMIMEMDFVTEPISIYEQLEIESIPYKMEMYLTDKGSYTKDSITNVWRKLPEELYSSTVEITKQQSDAALTLKKLKEYVDDLTMEEKKDHYILSFIVSGDKYKNFILDNINTAMPEGMSPEEVLEMISVNSINYIFTIEKETYYPRDLHMETDIDIDAEENKIHTVQNIEGTYSKFNEVEAINVPEEVKEQAVEGNQ